MAIVYYYLIINFSDLSLENFPMPNLTEFLSLGTPNITSGQTHVPSILDVSLPRNQWYFQYENKLGTGRKMILYKAPKYFFS